MNIHRSEPVLRRLGAAPFHVCATPSRWVLRQALGALRAPCGRDLSGPPRSRLPPPLTGVRQCARTASTGPSSAAAPGLHETHGIPSVRQGGIVWMAPTCSWPVRRYPPPDCCAVPVRGRFSILVRGQPSNVLERGWKRCDAGRIYPDRVVEARWAGPRQPALQGPQPGGAGLPGRCRPFLAGPGRGRSPRRRTGAVAPAAGRSGPHPDSAIER